MTIGVINMEITVSVEEIEKNSIYSLENEQPFSLVRIGDGEMIVMKNMPNINYFCEKQIGRSLNGLELQIVRDNLITAILNTNILGIPTPIQIEKNWPLENTYDYISGLKTNPSHTWKEKKYCGNNSHLDLLSSGRLFNILSISKKVCVVSCRDITERLYSRFKNISDIEYYSLPAEQSFEIVKEKNIDILKIINNISEKLKSRHRHGELLIYGSGPFGKHLGTEFASLGGVSLDLGSVFDLFVGKITRGKGKGPSVYVEPLL